MVYFSFLVIWRSKWYLHLHFVISASTSVRRVRRWNGWWKRGSSRKREIISAPWDALWLRRRSPESTVLTFQPPTKCCVPSDDWHPPRLISLRCSQGSLVTNWAHSEDSDQTWRMPRLICVFTRGTGHFVGLSCYGSYNFDHDYKYSEPPHDKTNKMACEPSKDSDQPGHPPSLIRVFTVRMKKTWVLSYPLSAQRRLWSDWADAQADLSLRWAHSHFVGFDMRRLTVVFKCTYVFKLSNLFDHFMRLGMTLGRYVAESWSKWQAYAGNFNIWI